LELPSPFGGFAESLSRSYCVLPLLSQGRQGPPGIATQLCIIYRVQRLF
jgi:hypothetical protein